MDKFHGGFQKHHGPNIRRVESAIKFSQINWKTGSGGQPVVEVIETFCTNHIVSHIVSLMT